MKPQNPHHGLLTLAMTTIQSPIKNHTNNSPYRHCLAMYALPVHTTDFALHSNHLPRSIQSCTRHLLIIRNLLLSYGVIFILMQRQESSLRSRHQLHSSGLLSSLFLNLCIKYSLRFVEHFKTF